MATTTTTTMPPRAPVARPATPAAPQRERRMTLDSIHVGTGAEALRLLIYGPEGVGKSTIAAAAPSPVYVGAEDGMESLSHVKRFPEPQNWQDVLDAVTVLIESPSPYKTLVIDTLDWIEPLLWRHVCESEKKESIEDFGFGKGYVKALDGWRGFVALLERLRKTRGMHIILLAHCHVKTWKNPEGDDFDRYVLKIHDKAAGLLKEWVAAVLFANYETFANKGKNEAKAKGIHTGRRLLYTNRTAAYDAKNRFNLPAEVELDWDALHAAIRSGNVSGDELGKQIAEKLSQVTDTTVAERAKQAVAAANGDPVRLARINDHLNQYVAPQAQE